MEHNLTTDTNQRVYNLFKSSINTASKLDISQFLDAAELQLPDSPELSLHPLNFDNQIEIEKAKNLLSALGIENPDWKIFIPLGDSDDGRVFVSEFLQINSIICGLIAIEMTSVIGELSSRTAVVSCILNVDEIEPHTDSVRKFISEHLQHLSNRQGWKDLKFSSLSGVNTLGIFQQW